MPKHTTDTMHDTRNRVADESGLSVRGTQEFQVWVISVVVFGLRAKLNARFADIVVSTSSSCAAVVSVKQDDSGSLSSPLRVRRVGMHTHTPIGIVSVGGSAHCRPGAHGAQVRQDRGDVPGWQELQGEPGPSSGWNPGRH